MEESILSFLIVVAFINIPILFAIVYFYNKLYGHQWEYFNSFNRKCKVCGRHEVAHCRDMQTWHQGWWEVFDEGDKSKHKGV